MSNKDEFREDVYNTIYSQLSNEKIDELLPPELIGEYLGLVRTLGKYIQMIIKSCEESCKELGDDIREIYEDLLKQVEVNCIKTYVNIKECENYTMEL